MTNTLKKKKQFICNIFYRKIKENENTTFIIILKIYFHCIYIIDCNEKSDT